MNKNNNDNKFMKRALDCASSALDRGDFPVGCVITYQNHLVATGERTDSMGQLSGELDHAEIHALKMLSTNNDMETMDNKQLTLYCTLEPCLMCFGAILIHRITRVVYAFEDAMGGGTSLDRSTLPPLYAELDLEIVSGVCRHESLNLFQNFFNFSKNKYLADSYLANYVMKQAV